MCCLDVCFDCSGLKVAGKAPRESSRSHANIRSTRPTVLVLAGEFIYDMTSLERGWGRVTIVFKKVRNFLRAVENDKVKASGVVSGFDIPIDNIF